MDTSTDPEKKNLPMRGGSETQFPGKLHDLMTYVESQGLEDIISWIREGRAIKVHNPEKLLDILPMFFGQTKYRSFQRQLNMWHFERILQGPDKGGFIHPYFVRGNKSLCAYMSRHLCDARTVPDQMIEPLTIQQLEFPDLLSPANTISNEKMETKQHFNDQLGSTTDRMIQPTIDAEDPLFLLSLNTIDGDVLGTKMQHRQPSIEKKSTNSFLAARGLESSSTSLSQLLEPISPEVFESLF